MQCDVLVFATTELGMKMQCYKQNNNKWVSRLQYRLKVDGSYFITKIRAELRRRKLERNMQNFDGRNARDRVWQTGTGQRAKYGTDMDMQNETKSKGEQTRYFTVHDTRRRAKTLKYWPSRCLFFVSIVGACKLENVTNHAVVLYM